MVAGGRRSAGSRVFSTRCRRDKAKYIPPVVSFRRGHGVSVTGGFVMRVDPEPNFHGVCICADYQTEHRLKKIRQIGTAPDRIVSFGRDRAGGLYAIGYDKGNRLPGQPGRGEVRVGRGSVQAAWPLSWTTRNLRPL